MEIIDVVEVMHSRCIEGVVVRNNNMGGICVWADDTKFMTELMLDNPDVTVMSFATKDYEERFAFRCDRLMSFYVEPGFTAALVTLDIEFFSCEE